MKAVWVLALAGAGAILGGARARAEDKADEQVEYDKYYQRAVGHVRKKSYDKAIENFEKALTYKRDTGDVFYNLVVISEQLKDYERVHLYAQGFLYLEPDTGDAEEVSKKMKLAKRLLGMRKVLPALVNIALEPKGTEIHVNYVPVSRGRGASFELLPGTYTARAERADHHPWSETIKVVDDTPVRVEGVMKKMIYQGSLMIETTPPDGVQVFIDDQPSGTTPITDPVKLETRRYLVRFEKEGYEAWLRYVEIRRDETATIKATLEKAGTRKEP
jgi:tetratricopeptide (TPR) repeat protein